MNASMKTNKELFKKLVRIGLAESISAVGDWITMMAVLALLVFRGEGGVTQSSGIFLAGILPMIPAGILAGKLCDRFDRRKLMITSQVLSALVVVGLVFSENQIIIYSLLALEAVTLSVMVPARQSSLPMLVSKEELTRANAFLSQLSALVKIGAPMLAGLVLTVFTPHQAIIFDVISFLLSALILRGLPALPPQAKIRELDPNPSSAHTGSSVKSVLLHNPGLQLLFLTTFCGVFILIGFDVLSSVFIRDILGRSERFMGLLIGLIGVGTLLSSWFLISRRRTGNRWMDVVIGLLLLAVIPLNFLLTIVVSDPIIAGAIALTGCLVGGFGNGLLNIQAGTLLQTLTPLESLGSVSGGYQSSLVVGQLLGTILIPLLVQGTAQMGPFFLISTAALICLAGFLRLQLKAWKRVDIDVSAS